MASNKVLNFEPAFLATASLASLGANLFNCAITSAGAAIIASSVGFVATQPYVILKHVKITNTLTTSAVTVTLYKGASLASASGTQFLWSNLSIPAQSYIDDYGQHRFDAGDYMVGIASLQQAVVINMDGEIGLA